MIRLTPSENVTKRIVQDATRGPVEVTVCENGTMIHVSSFSKKALGRGVCCVCGEHEGQIKRAVGESYCIACHVKEFGATICVLEQDEVWGPIATVVEGAEIRRERDVAGD